MKKTILLAVAWTASTMSVWAEDWKTTDGVLYHNVTVLRVEVDAVTILDNDGGALIPLAKLPPDLQKRFNYDPVKAKMAADARAKADRQNAKRLDAEVALADKLKKERILKDASTTNSPTAASR